MNHLVRAMDTSIRSPGTNQLNFFVGNLGYGPPQFLLNCREPTFLCLPTMIRAAIIFADTNNTTSSDRLAGRILDGKFHGTQQLSGKAHDFREANPVSPDLSSAFWLLSSAPHCPLWPLPPECLSPLPDLPYQCRPEPDPAW